MSEPSELSEPTTPSENGFAGLGLSPTTMAGVERAGFDNPTPIQREAIPVLLSGKDLIAQAQTGTGKTAAFGLPLLDRIDAETATPQALILCPTRELAVQVSEAIYAFGRPHGIRIVPLYGGQPIDRQLRALRAGVHVLVGTPGRILDHLRRGTLALDRLGMVVLDEADEMLDMGFVEDIEMILEALPEDRQTALFSATMPAPIQRLAQRHLKDPERIVIAPEPHNVPQIRQSYYEVMPARKVDALTSILDMETPGPTIIFCRTKREADEVGEHLRGRGYLAESLHGDLAQQERERVLRRFKEGQTELLVATDVAARGLDIETVTHVVNYDIPWDAESYTHRIGRTGRAGREGDAITLVTPRERRQLKLIERATGARIVPVRLPTAADIAQRRRELFQQTILEALEQGEFEDFLVTVGQLEEQFDPAEIAAAALKLLWKQQRHQASASEMEAEAGPPPEAGMARLFVTVGRQDGLRPTDLVGAIANEAGLAGKEIGTIDIMDRCAFVEVPSHAADRVVKALNRTTLRGRKPKAERAPEGMAELRPEERAPRPEDRGPRPPRPAGRPPRPAGPPAGPRGAGRPFGKPERPARPSFGPKPSGPGAGPKKSFGRNPRKGW
ncbi:MAG: DEAD/DEAH box helicase [Armatimonadota bacterium]